MKHHKQLARCVYCCESISEKVEPKIAAKDEVLPSSSHVLLFIMWDFAKLQSKGCEGIGKSNRFPRLLCIGVLVPGTSSRNRGKIRCAQRRLKTHRVNELWLVSVQSSGKKCSYL